MIIPYARQSISEADIQAVCEVLRSDFITQGPMIESFEKSIAKYCGAKYAVAVCNGTAALHIAYLVAGLGNSDRLWTSPNTFVATSNAALYCGAKVDFVDIDTETYCMSIDSLKQKLEHAAKIGELPKIVVPVHFSGQSCEMSEIQKLSQQYGFKVVEDACHGLGGEYRRKKTGSCAYSDMAVLSFHPVKIVTTGEGGMVLTNSEALYEKLILLRSHGITRDPRLMNGDNHGPWYYQQLELGLNFRMTDIQAALGLSQLSRIDQFIQKRHQIAYLYNSELKSLPLVLPKQHSDSYSSVHLYVIRLKTDELKKKRLAIFQMLRKKGIWVNVHYIPVHIQPYYQKLGFQKGDFPVAEQYYNEVISIPMFYDLKEKEQNYVTLTLKELIESNQEPF